MKKEVVKMNIKGTHEMILSHEGHVDKFDDRKSRRYGSWVSIATERTPEGEQVGDCVLHTIIDANYVQHLFKNLNEPGPATFSHKPDHRRMVSFVERKLMEKNLFGKEKKYQQLQPTGCENPPNLGTVLYAQSMQPHFKGCKYGNATYDIEPPIHANGYMPQCGACMQFKQHALFKVFGWTVVDPPLRRSKSVNGVTLERFLNLKNEMFKLPLDTKKLKEKIEDAIQTGNASELQLLLTEYEETVSYAQREIDEVFARMARDIELRSQKQVDSEICQRIAEIGTFAQLQGGLHIIGLMAGDADFTPVVHRAILDSSWSKSAETKHKEPRVKVVVFHMRGTADPFLTGDVKRRFDTQYAVNNRISLDILQDSLSGCVLDLDMLRSFEYSKKVDNDKDRMRSVNY